MRKHMQTFQIAALLLVTSTIAAQSQTCEERFKTLLLEGNGDGPVKILAEQEIVGGMISKNWFYRAADGHWMSEMIEPSNMQWTLTYNNALYSSSDKGESWNKIRDVDSAQNATNAKAAMKQNAETVTNAKCSQDNFEDQTYDLIEGDYKTVAGFQSDNHHKYWVNPETGFIRKAFYHMKAEAFESKTTQLIEAASGLQLPTPK